MSYPNLKAEMSRYGISHEQVKNATGVKSTNTVSNWLNGNGEIGVGNALKIQSALFPTLPISYLFDKEPSTQTY